MLARLLPKKTITRMDPVGFLRLYMQVLREEVEQIHPVYGR